MILELRLKNFYSLRDEQVLDMQAADIKSAAARALAGNVIHIGDESALKSVAVFGANALGKSSVIKAIRAAVEMIRESHNYNEDTRFCFEPFKLGGQKDASEFGVRLVMDGIEYEYSFAMTQTEILTESLYYYPNGRRSMIFDRDERRGDEKGEIYQFKSVIPRPMDVALNTSRKTLYLSRASQMDRELMKRLFRYFSEEIVIDGGQFSMHDTRWVDEVISKRENLLNVLQTADSDIVDIRVENGRLMTVHRVNEHVLFDLEREESEGTKILLRMALRLNDVLSNGKLMLIDEIDTSLHTKLVEYLVDLFHKSEAGQLIYTTHNTHLLNMKRIRKDQVYFVNKGQDGASELYSVFDFKDYRDTMDMENAYLQGRFDAVPYIG